ncbi:MAG: recombinase family protein, partial [Cyanobacteria bacterium P01_G01_bin.19]
MSTSSLWLTGASQTGKTSGLITEFSHWVRKQLFESSIVQPQKLASAALVFAANNQNRRKLSDRLTAAVEGTYPIVCKTPVGFITDEVMLFFPLIFEQLNFKAQFPLRLRPETEQELATNLWRNQPDWQTLCEFENEYRLVRQTLDLMQLAGASGVPTEDISLILQAGLLGLETDGKDNAYLWQRMGELLLLWQNWCLNRGFLTYGLIYELYWRYLLPNPQYQVHLTRRYRAIFADDVDDYPAIARDLFEFMLDSHTFAVFTYNPNGKIRLGLNADPDYLAGLAIRCEPRTAGFRANSLATEFAETAVELVTSSAYLVEAPDSIQSVQTISRAELLR